MMEGVASEAASLAGHLRLDNLCWVYDNNHISIEGNTRITFTEDVTARFLAYGWNVLRVGDANDIDSSAPSGSRRRNRRHAASGAADRVGSQSSLLRCRSGRHIRAGRVGQGAQRPRAEHPVAPGKGLRILDHRTGRD
jgi:pyruvate dehydrogenase complex dehydrogenase (E1) component